MKETIIGNTKKIANEAKNRSVDYIMAGLGLIVGLAWNEAIKALIEAIYPATSSGALLSKFIYAIIITLFLVIVSLYLIKEDKKVD